MKILNIMALYELNLYEQMRYMNYLGYNSTINGDKQQWIAKYITALSKPFEPEMITKLFEGWEIPDVGTGMRPVDVPKYTYYQSSDSSIGFPKVQIPHRQRYMEGEIGNGNDAKYYNFPEPKTIHDFITYCQGAGIELQAKKGGWSEN